MRSKSKKGFTIVELVIVIAIIAILAAVLIPTFSSLLKKANQSADQQAVHQMNVALAAEEAFGAPGDIAAALAVLEKAGLNGENYQPLTADTSFYWNKKLNRVVIADGENQVIYPEEYAGQFEGVTVEETKDGDCAWFSLVRPAGKYSVTYTVDNSKYVVRFYEDRTDNGSGSDPRYTYHAVAHTSEQYENGSVVTFWTDADEETGMITFTVTTLDGAEAYSFGILDSNKMGITIGAAPQSQAAAYQAPDGATTSLGTYTKYNPGNEEYQGLQEHITLVMEEPHKISWNFPSDDNFSLGYAGSYDMADGIHYGQAPNYEYSDESYTKGEESCYVGTRVAFYCDGFDVAFTGLESVADAEWSSLSAGQYTTAEAVDNYDKKTHTIYIFVMPPHDVTVTISAAS